MASRGRLVATALVATAALLAVGLLFSTGSSRDGYLGLLPFSPADMLPFLPRGIALAALRALRGVPDIFPVLVGRASASGKLKWKGACFYENEAWLEFHNDSRSNYGGGTVHIKTSEAHSWTCVDLYIFATPYRVMLDFYAVRGDHTLDFYEWESEAEYEYVKRNGVSIFLMPSGTLGTLQALWELYPLFSDSDQGENANLDFLKKNMGATFEERPKPAWVTELNTDDIHSGDFLVLSKIRGRWGGFETLEKWVTGAYGGHTAVCLRAPDGKLWVGESGRENEKGEDIIAIVPWEEWWEFELTKDGSNPHIALLPLHPDLRAKFNETAAWIYAKRMDGKPYGYHNLIFSWLDTVKDNYPPPLDANAVASVMTIWSQLQPKYAANLWEEALNKRLGTEGLHLSEIIVEAEKRGMTFDQLLSIPENDYWVYEDGESASCVAFVFRMYKEAGLFGSIASSVQATEFTIKDAYSLKFFEDNPTRLPVWCNKGDDVKLPFCQIKGKYRMELPGYNTMEPYPHMNERCPSLPPDYKRPEGC